MESFTAIPVKINIPINDIAFKPVPEIHMMMQRPHPGKRHRQNNDERIFQVLKLDRQNDVDNQDTEQQQAAHVGHQRLHHHRIAGHLNFGAGGAHEIADGLHRLAAVPPPIGQLPVGHVAENGGLVHPSRAAPVRPPVRYEAI
jgi:hypothetical protein